MEITIDGMGTVKGEVREVIEFANEIAALTKSGKARQALKHAIVEIQKSFETMVQVLKPLYGLTDDSNFTKNFNNIYKEFKGNYINNPNKVRTHCKRVKIRLDALLNSKEWQSNLPIFRRHYDRLQFNCNSWLFCDSKLADRMDSFLNKINRFFTDLFNLAQSNPSKAFAELRSGLQPYEDDFTSLQKQLNELDELSQKL